MQRAFFLNPPGSGGERFIREGRCMQSVDSWATAWPPLSLAGLAAIAREHGEVELLDACVEERCDAETVLERVRRFAPDLIVLSTAFPSAESDAAIAARLAEAVPGATVLGYGVLFTLLGEEALRLGTGFHLGIFGEPEATFGELLERRTTGEPPEGLAGLLWREGEEIRRGEERPWVEELDALPLPARDLLITERYRLPHSGRPFTLLQPARGCPYPCSFCVAPIYSGKRTRRRSVDSVLAEIEHCHAEQGLSAFLLWEEVFTLDRAWALEFCRRVQALPFEIEWAATTRADRLDDELLQAMVEAGCFLMGLGIESSSPEILERAGKGESPEQIQSAVEACRRAGLQTMGHFIFGLPGETAETVEATIDFALSLGLDYLQAYAAVPYPGTPLGEEARAAGWITTERWSDFDFGGQSVLDLGSLSPEEVDRARETLFRRFFLRPTYLMKQGRRLLQNPRQLRQAATFLNWMRTGGAGG